MRFDGSKKSDRSWGENPTELCRIGEKHLAAKCAKYGRELWPDLFTRRSAGIARLLAYGEGILCRLFGSIPSPCFFTLHPKNLGLLEHLAAPAGIFCHETVAAFRQAIQKYFNGPFWFRLEIGQKLRLHAHVVASRDAWNGSKLYSKACQTIYDLIRLARYLSKLQLPRTTEALGAYLNARTEGGQRLPRTSGQRGVPSKKTWHSKAQPTPSEQAAKHELKCLTV